MRRTASSAAAAVFAAVATLVMCLVAPVDAQQTSCSVPANTITSDCGSSCATNQLCRRKSLSTCALDCISAIAASMFAIEPTSTSGSNGVPKVAKLTLPSTITQIAVSNGNSSSPAVVMIVDDFLATNTQLTHVLLQHLRFIGSASSLAANLPPRLEYLSFYDDGLKAIPTGLPRLKSLKSLSLESNSISQVDPSHVIDSLTTIYLSDNTLTSFTAVYPNMLELNLEDNNFATIPAAIFKHTKLTTLYLTSNEPLKNVTLTSSQAAFINNLTRFTIDSGAFSTNCATSEQTKVKGYTVCIAESAVAPTPSLSSNPTPAPPPTTDNNYALIIIGCVAGVFAVVLLMVWRKQRSARSGALGDTNNTASTDTPMDPRSAAVALWNDPDLLAVKVSVGDIEAIKKIGSGAFCDVWLVLYLGSRQVASKRLREVTRSRTQGFIDEIKLVATLTHPNIVAFVGAAWTQEADLPALFEFMDGGDLRDYLTNKQTPRTWTSEKLQIAIDIAEALVYVHSFAPPLVHRDLKSRNVLLGSSGSADNDGSRDGTLHAKLTDFGVSRFRSEDNTMTSGVGTGKWLAPEVITGATDYGAPADIFSFGVVLSELDTHQLPYEDVRGANGQPLVQVAMLQLVSSGELRPSFLPSCPVQILELAQRCLSQQPADRPTTLELAYALRSYKKSLLVEM